MSKFYTVDFCTRDNQGAQTPPENQPPDETDPLVEIIKNPNKTGAK